MFVYEFILKEMDKKEIPKHIEKKYKIKINKNSYIETDFWHNSLMQIFRRDLYMVKALTAFAQRKQYILFV